MGAYVKFYIVHPRSSQSIRSCMSESGVSLTSESGLSRKTESTGCLEREREREREVHFKGFLHAVVEAWQVHMCRVGWQG